MGEFNLKSAWERHRVRIRERKLFWESLDHDLDIGCHPFPFEECVYHHLLCLRNAPFAELPTAVQRDGESDDRRLLGYRARLARISLLGISRMIKLALPAVQFWLDRQVGGIFRVDLQNGEGGNLAGLPKIVEILKRALESHDKDQLGDFWPQDFQKNENSAKVLLEAP